MDIFYKLFASCHNGSFFGLPRWDRDLEYEYLTPSESGTGIEDCRLVNFDISSDIWPIGLVVLEILLRLAAYVAVAMIIWGGFKYITSSGNPESTKTAQNVILNAVIGLVIALSAQAIVALIRGVFE